MNSQHTPDLTQPVEADESIINAIVKAIANHDNLAPTDLPPIYDEVEIDAIEKLYRAENSPVELSFRYDDKVVTIVNGEEIHISD